MDKINELSLGRKLILGAGILLFIDMFLHWQSVDVGPFTVGRNGIHGFWGVFLLLMTIAFLPFPTNLIADNLRKPGGEAAAIAYAATFVVMAAMHQVWWQYARRGRRLIADGVPDSALRSVDLAYWPGIPMYGVVLVVAFFSPVACLVLTFLIAAFYLPSAALFDR